MSASKGAKQIPRASMLLHSSFFLLLLPHTTQHLQPSYNLISTPPTFKGSLTTEQAARTFACCSCFPLWTRNPSLGCKPPQCSASADRRSRRWHRGVHSPLLPQLGSGLLSLAGTSPSGWQWDQRLPPRSASHLHKNLLLKLKGGDLLKHCSSKLDRSRGERRINDCCSDPKDVADTRNLPALLWGNAWETSYVLL